MTGVDFGMFEWIDRGDVALPQLYENRLQLLEAADAAGFFCYHLAEHHATPLGMAASPLLFLASAVQRTRRIRLGPLAILLPLYNPLRLIEEVCMLDNLSGGRLELGVSRGASPYELAYFGVDANGSRPIFDEALAILLAGMVSERLTFHGSHYTFVDVPMELGPLQRPYPPLWYPSHSLESMGYVGGNGFNFVGLGSAARVRKQVDAYWAAWEARQGDPTRLSGHVTQPKVGINRLVVVADSDSEALELARSAHADWNKTILTLWHAHGDTSHDELFSWETGLADETIIFGSPATVREQIARLLEVSGCNYVICGFAWGTLQHEHTLRSLRLFADEVMPAFVEGETLAGV